MATSRGVRLSIPIGFSMRRWFVPILTVLALTLLAGSYAIAQQPTQPAAPAPNVGINRSYWFEICLVVVLIGGALWAVCRSSNRQ